MLDAADICDEVFSDAIEIADTCARADIECHCSWRGECVDRWYDTQVTDPHEIEPIAQAVRYLTARGLIEQRGTLVRFKE